MEALQQLLDSYLNTYQALMWRMKDSDVDNRNLSKTLQLAENTLRLRRQKPGLWRVSEVRLLAGYFGLSDSSCIRLERQLVPFMSQVLLMPSAKRRLLEQFSQLNLRRMSANKRLDWSVEDLEKLKKGLQQVRSGRIHCFPV
ncbi:hypothetical protein GCM10028803_39670 [Larkinella knui]|uniref:Uncharacterized protein n=1 Tax=Larkinella knui TaxID=2025310 RepID=A0A3P1CEY6_9BACT|nr:hypothetical protein [Larkinella knui]RRB11807.1 hypothetical protein EHT87_25415 [Larkinella knui]